MFSFVRAVPFDHLQVLDFSSLPTEYPRKPDILTGFDEEVRKIKVSSHT